MSKDIEKIESAYEILEKNKHSVYFLTYDTKNNARAAIKHIYDMALTLRRYGVDAKILVEDNTYTKVNGWLGKTYDEIPVVTIKGDKTEVEVYDMIVVPEQYSNILEQLKSIKCIKVMLIQQKEYMFETLPIGSRWSDFGFDKVITTTELSKQYILKYFPETLVYVIPPIIGDNFKPTTLPTKPLIAISARDRVQHRKVISEFYLKYPQLRWITFRDMVQMTYDEFSDNLKECMVSLWIDDESTFGTFPLESMKCGVPVIGKIPFNEPDWLSENGIWTYDGDKLVELLGEFILGWLEGLEMDKEVKSKMDETILPYEKSITENNIITIFESLKSGRLESIKKALEKRKLEIQEEV
jgi:hypothetical protein